MYLGMGKGGRASDAEVGRRTGSVDGQGREGWTDGGSSPVEPTGVRERHSESEWKGERRIRMDDTFGPSASGCILRARGGFTRIRRGCSG